MGTTYNQVVCQKAGKISSKSDREINNVDKMYLTKITAHNIIFLKNIQNMQFEKLRTEILDNKNDLTVVDLNISKVISSVESGEELKTFSLGVHTIELIRFIENGNQLIPPFIINIVDDKWAIMDGKHRIALCIKLQIQSIPFIVRRRDLINLSNLTN